MELLWLYKLVYICVLFGKISHQIKLIFTFNSVLFNFVYWLVSICTECAICIVSMRGSILDTGPRATMHYWLYIKLGKRMGCKEMYVFIEFISCSCDNNRRSMAIDGYLVAGKILHSLSRWQSQRNITW